MGSEMASVAPPDDGGADGRAGGGQADAELAAKGWGAKRIARELGVARNTVRRYLRGGDAGVQQAPARAARRAAREARWRCSTGRPRAMRWSSRSCSPSAGSPRRACGRCSERSRPPPNPPPPPATVRFETAPGHQMQIDFGEKRVSIGGAVVRVYFWSRCSATRAGSS